jgi:hypothetical protein
MEEHRFGKHLKDFDLDSYHLGMNYAFIEVVASGCKRLALSPPLTEEEHGRLDEPTRLIAEEYGVLVKADADFLTTRLFNPEYTEGKIVLLFAHDEGVLREYDTLKDLKSREGGAAEAEVALRFGRLLSYDDETINGLLMRPRF